MKTIKNIIILAICFILSINTTIAQTEKVKNSLENLVGTDFFREYDSLKNHLQATALLVQKNEKSYKPEQYQKLQAAYQTMYTQMNALLQKMVDDFSDKKKLKIIQNDPETYANSYLYQLQTIRKNYQSGFNNLRVEYDAQLGLYTFNPAFIIPLIEGVIELIRSISKYIKDIKAANKAQVVEVIFDGHKVIEWTNLVTHIINDTKKTAK